MRLTEFEKKLSMATISYGIATNNGRTYTMLNFNKMLTNKNTGYWEKLLC